MKLTWAVCSLGMILTIFLSNLCYTGCRLDELRESVLRIHIIANSDSYEDQKLKLHVRDVLLENSEELFGCSDSLNAAVESAENGLPEARKLAQKTVYESGFDYEVKAEITDMYFTERVYGDITMPAGVYKALRITIGEAEGHNWWCVMYPPLCIPAAEAVEDDEEKEKECFTECQQDIMENPKKYKVRFMIWDKVKGMFE